MTKENITQLRKDINKYIEVIISSLNAKQKRIYNKTPINITKLAITFNLTVNQFNHFEFESFIYKNGIWVNENLSYEEKRFAIARELSYFILCTLNNKSLDKKVEHIIKFNEDKYSKVHQLLDCFALCLLIPSNLIKKVDSNKINNLAQKFGVSPKHLLKRIELEGVS